MLNRAFFLLLVTLNANAQSIDSVGRFKDDLLDHLAGKWRVTAIAHGSTFTSDLDADWTLNHQFFRIHLKSHEIIPWWGVQMEYEEFVGYNRRDKRYTVHAMSIEGDADVADGFCYGYRKGNEFKTVARFSTDSLIVQRFTWLPTSSSWTIKSVWEIDGKEGEPFLDMKLISEKVDVKRK